MESKFAERLLFSEFCTVNFFFLCFESILVVLSEICIRIERYYFVNPVLKQLLE